MKARMSLYYNWVVGHFLVKGVALMGRMWMAKAVRTLICILIAFLVMIYIAPKVY